MASNAKFPEISEMTRPILELCCDGKKHEPVEIRKHLIKIFKLSPSAGTDRQFRARVSFATGYLNKAGAIEDLSPVYFYSQWSITSKGKDLCKNGPKTLDVNMLKEMGEKDALLKDTLFTPVGTEEQPVTKVEEAPEAKAPEAKTEKKEPKSKSKGAKTPRTKRVSEKELKDLERIIETEMKDLRKSVEELNDKAVKADIPYAVNEPEVKSSVEVEMEASAPVENKSDDTEPAEAQDVEVKGPETPEVEAKVPEAAEETAAPEEKPLCEEEKPMPEEAEPAAVAEPKAEEVIDQPDETKSAKPETEAENSMSPEEAALLKIYLKADHDFKTAMCDILNKLDEKKFQELVMTIFSKMRYKETGPYIGYAPLEGSVKVLTDPGRFGKFYVYIDGAVDNSVTVEELLTFAGAVLNGRCNAVYVTRRMLSQEALQYAQEKGVSIMTVFDIIKQMKSHRIGVVAKILYAGYEPDAAYFA